MLLYLLSKEPDERSRRDHQAIEDQLICLRYFDQLHNTTKSKLYNELLRVMASNATQAKFEQGQLLWKCNDRQDKIMILYSGQVQQFKELSEDELDDKRKQFIKQYKQADLFTDKPGRRVNITYQQNGQLSVVINDAPRLRRTQVCEIPAQMELKRSNSIRHNRHPQLPLAYQQQLSQEMSHLLKDVRLQNESHFQYLLHQCVCAVKQTELFDEGELLNLDLTEKKHNTILFALTNCVVIQMNLIDYQNVENQIKIQKQSKIYRQLEAGFVSEATDSETEMHQLVKILMSKIEKITFNPNNIVYLKGQTFSHIYVIINGECQLSDEALVLARVNQGCLLGEESYGTDHYCYKCIATTRCKLYGVRTQDINSLCSRYVWFREQLERKQEIKSNWLHNRQQLQRARVASNATQQFHISMNKLTKSARQITLKTHRPAQSQNLFDKAQQEEFGLIPRKTFRYNTKYTRPQRQQIGHQSQPSYSKDTSTDVDIIPMLMNLDKQQSSYLKDLLKKGKIKPYTGGYEQQGKQTYLNAPPKSSTIKIMNRIQQQIKQA